MSDLLRLSNDRIEVVAARDYGPRIVGFRFLDSDNVLGDAPAAKTTTAFGDWEPRAGHRLWVAPELMPGSYAPDGTPVEWRVAGPRDLELRQPVDQAGIEKGVRVTLAPAGAFLTLVHTIVN